jgi:ABC-type transporter Mla subunit MlaD
MGELSKEEMRERLGNIEQIRDIIFGAQLREYNSRFEKLESDVSLLQQEMRDRIDEVKNVFSAELRSLAESLEKRYKTISLNVQEETTDLRQQLDRVNRKFSSNLEALNEAVDTQKELLREELSQTRERLQEDIRSLRTQVFEELEGHFEMLRDVKISKDDMAELLFELGMRLKGTEVVPKLKAVVEDTEPLANLLLQAQKESPSKELPVLERPQRKPDNDKVQEDD